MERVSTDSNYPAVSAEWHSGCHREVLKVVGGNLLANRGNSNRSPPTLSLVWKQEEALVSKKPAKQPPSSVPNPGWWQWFSDHADPIGVILTLIFAALWITWYVSKYDGRLENLEKIVSDSGGLEDKVDSLERSIARIEATADTLQKLLPLVLQLLKPQAAAALGTSESEVGIFNVAYNEVKTNAEFSVPLKNLSTQKQLLMNYTFKGEKNGRFSVRGQLQEVEGGRIVSTLNDQTQRLTLPSKEDKSGEYCFTFANPTTKVVLPFICIEVVFLDQVGPNNFIYASTVKVKRIL